MITLESDIFMCCRVVTTLGWENDSSAKALLERAANHVAPIMARRKWAVPVLKEFYPTNARLLGLNVNAGESIMVRVRRPSHKASFFDYGSILHTLLHELVHIEHGPHDSAFYAMLDVLLSEADRLPVPGGDVSLGTSAFAGAGVRLGDWSHKTVPRGMAGAAAAAAAAKRAQKKALMGGGVLGGSTQRAGVDPRVLAGQAAERRALDDVWCPRGDREVAARREIKVGDANVEVIEVEDDDGRERGHDTGSGVIVLD
jgi:DNA-dependent metalloprotease WSS1